MWQGCYFALKIAFAHHVGNTNLPVCVNHVEGRILVGKEGLEKSFRIGVTVHQGGQGG